MKGINLKKSIFALSIIISMIAPMICNDVVYAIDNATEKDSLKSSTESPTVSTTSKNNTVDNVVENKEDENTDEQDLKKIILCEKVSRLINTKAFLYENSQLFVNISINKEEFSNTFTIKTGNYM